MEPERPIDPPPAEMAGKSRRPYSPPAVAWVEVIDVKTALAAACDKINGSGGLCDTNGAS